MTPAGRTAIVRADAGPQLGAGHLMRCAAIAESLAKDGWRTLLATARSTLDSGVVPPPIFEDVFALEGDEREAMFRLVPDGCDLLIVDHYERDRTFEARCRPWARQILVIDDLADRPHDTDFLLDMTPGRDVSDYEGLVSENCRSLFGPKYAPIRRAFSMERHRKFRESARRNGRLRLLVAAGASDPTNMTADIIKALPDKPWSFELHVVLTSQAPFYDIIRDILAPIDGHLHTDVSDMERLLSDADVTIGAGGMTSWERCCLGIPTVMLVTAQNQRRNGEALKRMKVAVVVEKPEEAVERAISLLDRPKDAKELSRHAALVCDGLGADRIAMFVGPERCRDDSPVHLRPADEGDEAILYAWQTDPATRKFFRETRNPTTIEHAAWFKGKLNCPTCIFSIVLHRGTPAGSLRMDFNKAFQTYEVSINIGSKFQQRGIAGAALRSARRLIRDDPLYAFVQPENAASLALFQRAGYRAAGKPCWYVQSPMHH
jgi:UDP-2,4-diacetamido-2,4,6-trideoxy-beta-L-altropyranose hydrolase